jgi:hypothetical protein
VWASSHLDPGQSDRCSRRSDVEQGQQHQSDSGTAVVAAQARERLAQPRAQVDLAQIAPEQLQAAVSRERLGHELDCEITLDHPPQARYRQTHQRGLQCLRECIGVLSLETALEASLIHIPRCFPSHLFADWGLVVSPPRLHADLLEIQLSPHAGWSVET